MTATSPVRLLATHLDVRDTQAHIAGTLVTPAINVHLPPLAAAAWLRGAARRTNLTACYVDLASKRSEWIVEFVRAVSDALVTRPPDAPIDICLRIPESVDAATLGIDLLEPQPITLDHFSPPEGFALWQPGANTNSDEDALAHAVWSQQDYDWRWKDNKGRYFYYSRRNEEAQIRKHLAGAVPFVLAGQALAGKTRLLLRALLETRVTVLAARTDATDWAFPPQLPEGTWLVIDDIDRMLESPAFRHAFIEFAGRNSLWCATCRSGEGYEQLRSSLPPRQIERLQTVLIGRLNDKEVESVVVQLSLARRHEKQRAAPRNIGYYFLNTALEVWRSHYARLPADEKAVLRATSAALRLGFGTPNRQDTIDQAIPAWMAHHAFPDKPALERDAFDVACAKLDQSADSKGWWEIDAVNGLLRLEPVFIDEIIDQKFTLAGVDSLRRMTALVGQNGAPEFLADTAAIARWSEQALRAGLRFNAADYAQIAARLALLGETVKTQPDTAIRALIHLWLCAEPAVRPAIVALGTGHSPSACFYLNLVLRDADVDSHTALDLCRALVIKADAYTFNTLIAKLSTGGNNREALRFLQMEMRSAGVEPDVVTFTTLIEKAASESERQRLLADMRSAGVEPNVVTFNTLMNKSASLAEVEAYFGRMREAGIRPNHYSLPALIKACPSYDAGRRWLESFQTNRFPINEYAFKALRRHAVRDEQRAEITALEQSILGRQP